MTGSLHAFPKADKNTTFKYDDRWLVVLITALSVGVRLAALLHFGTGTIESEGAEYARIAQNLRNGTGFVGLVSAGPQVLFAPLFPLLIAAASYVTPDFEIAGRLVALIFGTLLPLPVLGIASRLFNRQVGYLAAILVALHPALFLLSFSVYSEGPYITILLTAVYLALRAMESDSTLSWILVGAVFALAFLVRPEGLAAFGITVLLAMARMRTPLKVRSAKLGFAVLAFLLFALPEVVFLHAKTGKFMLEGRSRLLFSYTGSRVLTAMRHPGAIYESAGGLREQPIAAYDGGGFPEPWEDKWAFYGIDENLKDAGTAMRPFVDSTRDSRIPLRDVLTLVKMDVRNNLPPLVQKLSSGWAGGLLTAFALLGIARRPWRDQRAWRRLYVLCVMAVPAVAIIFVLWSDERYYFVYIPFMSIWAANGVWEFGRWARATSAAARWSFLKRPFMSRYVVPALAVLAVVALPAHQIQKLFVFSDSARAARPDKLAGQWIGSLQNRSIRIMDLSLPLSFHAGAQQHVYFPYCDADQAIRYLDAAQIDYVVLRRDREFTKYYAAWLSSAIPDQRAELLQLPPDIHDENLIVYRWHWREGASQVHP